MKIELTETKIYSFTLGGKVLDGFVVASRWNGLTELRRADGQRLILEMDAGSDGLAGTFADIFADVFSQNREVKKHSIAARVVSASPELLSLISAIGIPATLASVEPGDKVMLRSGGPEMTVIGMTIDGAEVACQWEVGGLHQGNSFPLECLTAFAPA